MKLRRTTGKVNYILNLTRTENITKSNQTIIAASNTVADRVWYRSEDWWNEKIGKNLTKLDDENTNEVEKTQKEMEQ